MGFDFSLFISTVRLAHEYRNGAWLSKRTALMTPCAQQGQYAHLLPKAELINKINAV